MTQQHPTPTTARPRPAAEGHKGGPSHLGVALGVIGTAQLMVVLDAAIVNVALPSIQRDLHFSAANLLWVVNAYTLAFGGMLLLGGRAGDLFGRRRMFMVGIAVFIAASFMGGLAQSELWLIVARAVQGLGAAVASPTALALVTTTFPEGPARDRAMGVYASMSGSGAAVGVLLGGVLTETLSWRYVLFVNVPIGLAVLLLAPRVLGEGQGKAGRLDLPGALLASGGISLVVFGLIHAASTSWGDTWSLLSLAAGLVLLVGFVMVEQRAPEPLMPLRLLGDRNRSGAYLVMLALTTALFGIFYFLTLFLQDILGLSALTTGFAYLPFAVTIVVMATGVSRVIHRTGFKPPLMVGTLLAAGGVYWLSTLKVSTSYLGGVLPPMLIVAAGLGMCFVSLTLAAVSRVKGEEAGIASALLNTGQQVGGALGLAVLGTIAVTVTTDRLAPLIARFGAHGAALVHGAPPPPGTPIPAALRHTIDKAFVHGYGTAFGIAAAIMAAAFVLVAVMMRRGAGEGSGQPASGDRVSPSGG